MCIQMCIHVCVCVFSVINYISSKGMSESGTAALPPSRPQHHLSTRSIRVHRAEENLKTLTHIRSFALARSRSFPGNGGHSRKPTRGFSVDVVLLTVFFSSFEWQYGVWVRGNPCTHNTYTRQRATSKCSSFGLVHRQHYGSLTASEIRIHFHSLYSFFFSIPPQKY